MVLTLGNKQQLDKKEHVQLKENFVTSCQRPTKLKLLGWSPWMVLDSSTPFHVKSHCSLSLCCSYTSDIHVM